MHAFQHLASALRLFHGVDSLRMLPRELHRLGSRRAVIFCGRTLAADSRALGLVRDALGECCAGVFDGVRAHSPVRAVQDAATALKRFEADAVVAVGGGSAIVTARAASILAAETGDIRALCTQRGADGKLVSPKLAAAKLPQFVIPTTPTTACVKAGSAVFDELGQQRLALFDPKTRAQAVFIHPELALTANAELARTASLNTLAMAVEGLESASGDPLADGMLMQSLRLLRGQLPRLREQPADTALRGDLMVAAVLCGQGTDHSGGGLASVLGHAIGARCGIENGLASAMVLPHTMRFNLPVTAGRLPGIAEALGAGLEPGHKPAIARVEALLAAVGVPSHLRDAGVAQDALPGIAAAALDDWFLQRNPRPVADSAAVLDVLRAAW